MPKQQIPTATSVESSALAASLVIKTTPGKLFSLIVTNTKSSDQYIQLHDAAALPADAVVPGVPFLIPANSTVCLDYSDNGGRYFYNGIVVCNSSTVATKTIGSADCFFCAEVL